MARPLPPDRASKRSRAHPPIAAGKSYFVTKGRLVEEASPNELRYDAGMFLAL